MSCFNTEHHDPHTPEELRDDVFHFVADMNTEIGVDVDPKKVWDDIRSMIMNCMDCHHPKHIGRCGHPITQDIRMGRGMYDPIGIHWRTDIVGTCYCDEGVDDG